MERIQSRFILLYGILCLKYGCGICATLCINCTMENQTPFNVEILKSEVNINDISTSDKSIVKILHSSSAEQQQTTRNTQSNPKEELLKFLTDMASVKTISGLYNHSFKSDSVNKALKTFHFPFGGVPGIVATEIPDYSANMTKWEAFVNATISNWNNDYLVLISWEMLRNPFISMDRWMGYNETEWNDLISEGGRLNKKWKTELDILAIYLKQIQSAGVVPICDLFPDINLDYLLWNGRPGLSGSLKLYQLSHDYLTHHHNLHSLIWVWSLCIEGDMTRLKEYWPGNNFVDVVSVDMNNKNELTPEQSQIILNVIGNKLISMDDLIHVPSPQLLEMFPWSWFTVCEIYLGDFYFNSDEDINITFRYPRVANKGEFNFLGIKRNDNSEKEAEAAHTTISAAITTIKSVNITIESTNTTLKTGIQKDQLYDNFKRLSSSKTISGLYVTNPGPDRCSIGLSTFQRISGVLPGILTTRMPKHSADRKVWQLFVNETISNWNNNYLVHIRWDKFANPLTDKKIFAQRSDAKWNDLITEGGELNKAWKKEMDAIVPHLKQIEAAGVQLIFNILPFINVDSAMWSGRPGINGSIKVYQMTHNYLTQHHSLKSLLWVWSISAYGDMKRLKKEYWPGANYVDVATVYIGTTKQLSKNNYQKLLGVVGNKMISMEYMATVPSVQLLQAQPQWTWFTVLDITLDRNEFNTNANINATFNSHFVINKGNNQIFKTME